MRCVDSITPTHLFKERLDLCPLLGISGRNLRTNPLECTQIDNVLSHTHRRMQCTPTSSTE